MNPNPAPSLDEEIARQADSGTLSSAMQSPQSPPPARASKPNPHANERPQFNFCHGENDGDRHIVDDDGRVIATVHGGGRPAARVEQDARMLAFAGKVHWALGNASANLKGFAQDASVLAMLAQGGQDVSANLRSLAAKISQCAHNEGLAYEGALVTGHAARQFDEVYRQDGIGAPVVVERPLSPENDQPVCPPLPSPPTSAMGVSRT